MSQNSVWSLEKKTNKSRKMTGKKYTMPNKCPVCGKRFKYLFMMNEHLKKSKICSTQVVQPDVEEAPQQLGKINI